MKHINFNISLSVFITGALMFLLAPVMTFDSYSTREIFMTGIIMQIVGITVGLIEFFKYKMDNRIIENT
jgi:hypothetical protein